MSDRNVRTRRPLAIPVRVLMALLIGIGLVAAGMRLGQSVRTADAAVFLQIGGMLVCLWALYEGTRSIRLSNLARPVRPMWGNREVSLTSEGVVLILILLTTFIAAFLGKSNLLLLVFSFLAATFLLNGSVTNLMLDKNRGRRKLPGNIMVGETLAVEVTLGNKRRWLSSWMMVLQDQIRNSREILQPRVLFPRVPAGGERSGWYQVRFGQRGLYEFGPLKLITRFPLGFVERGTLIEERNTIIVHPRVGFLTPLWRNETADAEDLMRHSRSRVGTHDDDFHRLREYRTGDNPKAIHWLSTARNNELMVREYHETRDRDLIVFLDLFGNPDPQVIDQQVERAVSFAATLIVDHCRRNRGASIAIGIASERRFVWRGPAGPNIVPHLLDELSQAHPSADPPVNSVSRELQDIQWSKCHRLLITTRLAGDLRRILESASDRQASDLRHPFKIIESSHEVLARYLSWGTEQSEYGTRERTSLAAKTAGVSK
ncbi:MAG: DUF58 domain-containing protein [Planctomycetaceae bacterium]|nr:DUF58 domain-containing protein [Planctomycetaceae bacterium]